MRLNAGPPFPSSPEGEEEEGSPLSVCTRVCVRADPFNLILAFLGDGVLRQAGA